MLQQGKQVKDGQNANVMPAGQHHGRGIVKGNPTRCIMCGRPIGKDDTWVKQTAGADPETATTYSIIIHDRCNRRRQ